MLKMNACIGLVILFFSHVLLLSFQCFGLENFLTWQLGPFERIDEVTPILTPSSESTFHCPLQDKEIHWEGEYTFNPGAVVHNDAIYLFYRAEDNYGVGCGQHTSRLGLAISHDGVHFQRYGLPVLFPDNDDQKIYEWPGGCEDPRIVETDEGTFVMTYTQWNRQVAVLGIAASDDLLKWKKHGYAFKSGFKRWSKSGSIVCRCEGDRLIATKIQGKYWMYWGEGVIHAAISEDLISWTPKAYSAGQILLDPNDPTQVIARSEDCFLTPARAYEMNGQYTGGTIFVQGLVHFHDKWLLYYGMADSSIGIALSE